MEIRKNRDSDRADRLDGKECDSPVRTILAKNSNPVPVLNALVSEERGEIFYVLLQISIADGLFIGIGESDTVTESPAAFLNQLLQGHCYKVRIKGHIGKLTPVIQAACRPLKNFLLFFVN